MSVETLVKQIEELPLEQRAELVYRVEQGLLDAGWDSELAALLDEREADADAHPGEGMTIDEAFDALQRRK